MGIAAALISCAMVYSPSPKKVENYAAQVKRTNIVMLAESENLSQLIRSNIAHYWGWSKKQVKQYEDFAPYAKFEGIVAGDPHLGNFLPLPMKDSNGRTKLKYSNADLDDAGRGSFALDFARLLVATKAITKEVKYTDLIESYQLGLTQKRQALPETLKEIFEEYGVQEYRDALSEYVSERTEGNRFAYEPGKIERYRGKITLKEIQKLFPDDKVLDLANRPQDRGGSKGSERIWVLVERRGQQTIFELKTWEASRLSFWTEQSARMAWLGEVTEVFDKNGSAENYRIVDLSNGKAYWLREKKFTIIDIPYSADTTKKVEYIDDLANHAAYQLGVWHGQQSSAKRYVSMVSKDVDAFQEAIKVFVKDYLEKVEAEFE